jgi:hypothetical protein
MGIVRIDNESLEHDFRMGIGDYETMDASFLNVDFYVYPTDVVMHLITAVAIAVDHFDTTVSPLYWLQYV